MDVRGTRVASALGRLRSHRARFISAVAIVVTACAGLVSASPTTVGALGPDAIRPGFDSSVFAANDDASTTVALPFPVDFFGTTYNQLFLNNNGNVTFDDALSTFTPFDLASAGRVIIAAFFADVDTRVGNTATYGSGTVNGRPAWGVNWNGVACFDPDSSVPSAFNYFQLLLVDRSDIGVGDFDIEFNYDQIQWEAGTASGGDANCLNGNSARVGYSDGTATNTFELPGSAVNGAFLDTNLTTGLVHNSLNNAQLGRYDFPVRSGQPRTSTTVATSLSGGAQSGASITVPTGTSVTDTATLSGANAASATGTVVYTAYSDNACTTAEASGGTKTVAAGTVPSSDPVVFVTPGTRYWQAAYSGDSLNLASTSACGDEVETVNPAINLAPSVVGTPDPVTAGNDVQYTVAVKNNGAAAVPAVQVSDTLPAGTIFVSATAPGGCAGTGPVTCQLGTIAQGATATATIVVRTAAGSGGTTVTDSATTTPGGSTASFVTHIATPVAGTVTAYVPPGGSIDTGGNNPANLSLPNTGVGAAITITQRPNGNNFCQGACNGTASFVSDFPGYNDPTHPIRLKLTFTDSNVTTGLVDYATSTIYKVRDDATVGVKVPDCKDNPAWTSKQKFEAAIRRLLRIGTKSGIANPAPCVDSRTIVKGSGNTYKVTFEILFLSDDGGFSRR